MELMLGFITRFNRCNATCDTKLESSWKQCPKQLCLLNDRDYGVQSEQDASGTNLQRRSPRSCRCRRHERRGASINLVMLGCPEAGIAWTFPLIACPGEGNWRKR